MKIPRQRQVLSSLALVLYGPLMILMAESRALALRYVFGVLAALCFVRVLRTLQRAGGGASRPIV